MYIATVPNRNSPPAILLRESYREKGKVKTRTLANLSHLPKYAIDLLRRSLKGERFVSVDKDFEKVDSWHHGHVDAVLRTMKRLGFDRLINNRRCKERDIVIAMVVGRILEPDNEKNSKLANTRWWETTTLPALLDLEDVNESDLYAAMDWLLERQATIEKKLAHRHLADDGLVLYDLTSSYFEGVTCPLAALGHNRDGKKGKLQVNYGLLTDDRGCPVAVSVFPGNTSDAKTLTTQTKMVKDRFGIKTMVLVGDRGMITQKIIDEELKDTSGVDWITALRSETIKKLVKQKHVQLGLFDEMNLFEISIPDYPDERLIVCRNPELAKQRAYKRQALLEATAKELNAVRCTVENGKLRGEEKISNRLKNLVKQYKMAGQFRFTVREDGFDVLLDDKKKATEFALAGAFKEFTNVRSSIERGKLEGSNNIRKKIDKIVAKYNLTNHVLVNIRAADFEVRVKDKDRASVCALASVCEAINKIRSLVEHGTYGGKDKIGVCVGKVVNKYKVAKHFVLNIKDDRFDYQIDEAKVATEAALDGIYIIRTSLVKKRLSAEDTVRSYKSLSRVERAFRSIKTVDIKVRPIRHRLGNRVRAHIFLCMLAYYVEWYMREALRPLLFVDEEKTESDNPVEPAKRSVAAMQKVQSKRLEDGTIVHSFQTLLKLMSQIVRNECRLSGTGFDENTFEIVTTPNEKQKKAYRLLDKITL